MVRTGERNNRITREHVYNVAIVREMGDEVFFPQSENAGNKLVRPGRD
jgi:hypothetical protein